jgi:V/A-type H+-transporting ATPase subunit I
VLDVLVPMAKIEIIGPKNRFMDVVSLLHEHGTLHIEDLTKKIDAGEIPVQHMSVDVGQATERDRMEDLLIRVRAIIRALHLPGTRVDELARQKAYLELWRMPARDLAGEVTGVIDEVEERAKTLAQSKSQMEDELALLARYEPILNRIQPLARQIVTTRAFESVALLIERRYRGLLDQLKIELDEITHKQCEIVSADVDDATPAAIVVFSKTYSEPVHKFLSMENLNQIRLPSDLQDMPFDQAYSSMHERQVTIPRQLEEVRKELEATSDKWFLRLSTIRDVLTDKLDEMSAIPEFGQTGYAFVITGWVPISDLLKLRSEVQATFGEDVIVDQLDIGEKDMADTPVSMENPAYMKPFESLLSVYGTPRYGTIDPTWSLFVFYPLFFGMIVGDIGYGLVMLAIVIWLRIRYRQNDGIQLATSVLGPAATMVVVFGFLYGEFFGNIFGKGMLNIIHEIHLGPITLPFERVQSVMVFMILAVAVGVIQVLLGLVLGVVNAVRTKNKHHLQERGGILTLLLAIFIAVGAGFMATTLGSAAIWIELVFAIVALAGFVFAIRGGGVMGGVETIMAFSHMASYIRIMAVGLAGAIFAEAVNGIAIKSGNLVVGVIIALLLHSLNFVIAAFSPTIHALRLNFLEFFGNFFETSTTQYSPFHKSGGERQA